MYRSIVRRIKREAMHNATNGFHNINRIARLSSPWSFNEPRVYTTDVAPKPGVWSQLSQGLTEVVDHSSKALKGFWESMLKRKQGKVEEEEEANVVVPGAGHLGGISCGQAMHVTGRFVRTWGSKGQDDGQLFYPFGICTDGKNCFVAEYWNHRIQVFDEQGNFVHKWGSDGGDEGQLHNPIGMCCDDEYVYVVDHGNCRIQVFDKNGIFIRAWGSYGHDQHQYTRAEQREEELDLAQETREVEKARKRNRIMISDASSRSDVALHPIVHHNNVQFNGPSGICCDAEHVYVTDTYNHHIQVFDKFGGFVRMWGIEGNSMDQLHTPVGICCDDTHVYVAEVYNHRIQVFDKQGEFVRMWGSKGNDNGQFLFPEYVCCDSKHVYVSDAWNDRIQVFDKNGKFEYKWGAQGEEEGEFNKPTGICADPHGQCVYISDNHNHRVQVFK